MNGYQVSPCGVLPLPYTHNPAHYASGFPQYPQQQQHAMPSQRQQPYHPQHQQLHQRQRSLSRQPGLVDASPAEVNLARAHLDRLFSNAAAQHGGYNDYSSVDPTYVNKANAQLFRLPTPPGMYASVNAPMHPDHQMYAQQAWPQREASLRSSYGHPTQSAYHHGAAHFGQLGSAFEEQQQHRHYQHQRAVEALQPAHQVIDNISWQQAIMAPRHNFGNMPAIDLPTRYDSLPVPNQPGHEYQQHGWPGRYPQNPAGEQLPLDSNFFDNDHPSFAKPPHRHAGGNGIDGKSLGFPYFDSREAEADQSLSTQEEPQLIAPGASAILPPPPIEESAYPLAALATDIVWEAFIAAAQSGKSKRGPAPKINGGRGGYNHSSSPVMGNHPTSSPPSLFHSRLNRECYSSSSPSTPFSTRPHSQAVSPQVDRAGSAGAEAVGHHLGRSFGAIGGERRPRHLMAYDHAASSPTSDVSSPASSAPGTPAQPGHSFAWTSGLRVWEDEAAHSFSPAPRAEKSFMSSHASLTHGSRFENPSPPRALFEQIQKLLGATLLSQQVLLLALHFIARLPPSSPLYPPATSQSALRSTSAPFKLLLSALVVANKHLDDNSFRNSTFSSVSDVALHEINALEHSLLAALSFDVNVEPDNWLNWLRELEYQQPTRFTDNQVSVAATIGPLIASVCGDSTANGFGREHQINLNSSPVMETAGSPEMFRAADYEAFSPQEVPAARGRKLSYGHGSNGSFSPRSDGSYSTSFDFDAPVPHELRPRYAQHNNPHSFRPDVPLDMYGNSDLWGRPLDRMAYSYERGLAGCEPAGFPAWARSGEMITA